MIEDIFDRAKQVADAAGKKTSELVGISKLKLSAMQLGNEIRELYRKLGGAVYSMTKADYENPELVAALVEEIDEKREALQKLRDQIAMLQKAKACPCCQTKNHKDAAYCQRCGSKLPDAESDAEDYYYYGDKVEG